MATSFQTSRNSMTVIGTTTTSPTITNLSVPSAATEVSHVITTGTKVLTIRARNAAVLQFAFVSTESGTKFVTIPKRASYTVSGITTAASLTLYIQSSTALNTVEILEWA